MLHTGNRVSPHKSSPTLVFTQQLDMSFFVFLDFKRPNPKHQSVLPKLTPIVNQNTTSMKAILSTQPMLNRRGGLRLLVIG